MAMDSLLYEARFFGGPSDGLLVVSTRPQAEVQLSVPVDLLTLRRLGLDECWGRVRAIYRLETACQVAPCGRQLMRRDYGFLGFEVTQRIAT